MAFLKQNILLIISVAAVAGLIIAVPVAPSSDTIFSVSETDDGQMKFFYVSGDYRFDDYLKTGSSNLNELYSFLADNVTCGKTINGVNPVNCSSFITASDDGSGYYAGRNFDFRYVNTGVVFTHPSGGYSSCSTVDLRMFGDTDETFSDMKDDTRFNAVAYIPMDGINEKGLFTCINSVNMGHTIAQNDEGKIHIFTTSALRLILDNAATTSEAVELISQYNLCSASNFHIFIGDLSGDSRCVEYVDNVMYVTETKLLTNHYLTEHGDVPAQESSLIRFATLQKAINDNETMSQIDVIETMSSVVQNNPDGIHYTRWTVVYDMDERDAVIFVREDGDMSYETGYAYSIYGRK